MLKKIIILGILLLTAATGYAKERQGEVLFKVTISAPEQSDNVRLWLPYPVSDDEQTIEDVKIDGNFSYSAVYGQQQTQGLAIYAEWTKPETNRFITLSFKAKASERMKKEYPSQESQIPVDVNEYLKGSDFIPTNGKIRDIALKATRGKKTVKEKAEAIYAWVVENTYRDPNIKGCGTGDVERILAEHGGKCADISSVFVALARAAGVPAREVFGLRLGKKPEEDITGGHHCWAEFYLPGYGWVPVDPADVRKAMLVEKLELTSAQKYRDYYFGAVDEYRIALTRGGKGIFLNPQQQDGLLAYFMYPYAEIDGKGIEWLAAQKELKYEITFKELSPR